MKHDAKWAVCIGLTKIVYPCHWKPRPPRLTTGTPCPSHHEFSESNAKASASAISPSSKHWKNPVALNKSTRCFWICWFLSTFQFSGHNIPDASLLLRQFEHCVARMHNKNAWSQLLKPFYYAFIAITCHLIVYICRPVHCLLIGCVMMWWRLLSNLLCWKRLAPAGDAAILISWCVVLIWESKGCPE